MSDSDTNGSDMSDGPVSKNEISAAIDHIGGQQNNRSQENSAENTADNHMSWLQRFKARFGLEGSRTLRDTIASELTDKLRAEDVFTQQERLMLHNILRFGGLRVDDVMVPRADIIAIDYDASLSELLSLFEDAGHSRVPVFVETLDDPVGIVHIKDLTGWIANERKHPGKKQEKPAKKAEKKQSKAIGDLEKNSAQTTYVLANVDLNQSIRAAKLKRDVLFVPPSMPVVDLLLRMQSTHVHLALVIDEYGGTDGLVSIEDLVEEIVGEIEDEHDTNGRPLISQDALGGLIADARTPIEDLESYLAQSLALPEREEDDIETLGGLIFSLVGRVPSRGEIISHPSGFEFEVLDVDPRRIKKLKIHAKKGVHLPSAKPAGKGKEGAVIEGEKILNSDHAGFDKTP